ncbi:MAG: hypothetical protein Q8909_14800 [Bacteroidota bacterium]|nr:hypothetical protein [Bacteroidota bacterium]
MKKTILYLLLFCCIPAFSQLNNIEQYLDDGGRTATKNIIKTDFTQMLLANIPVIFEHRFNNNLSLQGGVGLLTQNFFHPVIKPIFATDPLYSELKGGYSLYVEPLFYGNGFESLHIGIPLRYRRHGDQVESYEFNIALGYQWFKGRHLSYDIEIGAGFNLEYSLDGVSYIYNSNVIDKSLANDFRQRLVFPVSFKAGYVF